MFRKRIKSKPSDLSRSVISSVLVVMACQINPVILLASVNSGAAATRAVDSYSLRQGAVERTSTKGLITNAYARLPLSFEPNRGQTDAGVKFFARGAGYRVFLSGTEVVLGLSLPSNDQPGKPSLSLHEVEAAKALSAVVRMRMLGANSAPKAVGIDELPGKSNYFLSSDPTKWVTKVPTFSRVRFSEVYPGIEAVYYGSQQELEYDFVVAPGYDPGIIRLEFDGASRMRIDGQGSLVLETSAGQVRQQRPVVYQEVDGVRREVLGNYQLLGHHCVGFKVGAYDTSKPLVIDPVVVYSSYLGGSSNDSPSGVAVDSAGAIYLTGYTFSHTFPTSSAWTPTLQPAIAGAYDAFVTKLTPDGSAVVYSTFLGGASGDYSNDVAVDRTGCAYIAGGTGSSNFPTLNALQPAIAGGSGGDAFVAKLNSDGSALVYSTFLGGPDTDYAAAIAVDASGSVYIDGQCGRFPVVNALQAVPAGGFEAFVAKLNPAGSALVYSTYLGGSREDTAFDIAVDLTGNVYVVGQTESANFPTWRPLYASFGGRFDAFVTKINSAGTALVFSSFLGGSALDGARAVAVDSMGNVYVGGFTSSVDFPTWRPIQPLYGGGGDSFFSGDGFVTKLNPAGSALIYSTYIGGSESDAVSGIAVDLSGNLYLAGSTRSSAFPTVRPAQAVPGGGFDAFMAKLNPTGSGLVHSTYFGGIGDDSASDIALDSGGNVYLTGTTSSFNFPTRNAFQPSLGGGIDGFVARFSDETSDTACFIHQATPANSVGNYTYLDHPLANNPNAVVFVTPNWNPGGVGAVYNNHHTGVWYDGSRWAIFNQDFAAIPNGASFNVFISRSATSTDVIHSGGATNIVGSSTYIDHPLANGNPNAILKVTPNWNPGGVGGVYDDSAIGVWYDGSRWAVFNQNFRSMPFGAAFNVSITGSASSTEFIHQARSANITGHYTYIDHPLVNGNPNVVLMVTPNWNPGGVVDASAIGVWYTGSRWAIFNQDFAAISNGAAFNVRVCN